MKRAVVYYSLSGNTKEAAEKIAAGLEADLIRIETVKSMPKSMAGQIMYGGMQATFGICPKIKGMPENISEYDEIILGTPIWAGKTASAINTILKADDVRKRIIGVFTFSGGGDNDGCMAILAPKLPSLKHVTALADRNNKLAEENDKKTGAFIEAILGQ